MAGLGTEISPIVLDSSSCSSGSCDDSTESDDDSSLEYLGSVQGALPEFRPELKPTIFLGDDECMIVRVSFCSMLGKGCVLLLESFFTSFLDSVTTD